MLRLKKYVFMHGDRRLLLTPVLKGVFTAKRLFGKIAGAERSRFVLIVGFLSTLLVSCGNSGGRLASQTLPPPGNVHVACVKQGVEVAWKRVPGASHYTVFWGLPPRNYHKLADSKSTSLVISGLLPGKLYAFAVSSWNKAGESGYSGEKIIVFDDGRGSPEDYLAQARKRAREGSLLEAHAYTAAAIRLDPRLGDAYRLRAVLNEQLNKPELASQDYAKAEKLLNGSRVTLRRSTN